MEDQTTPRVTLIDTNIIYVMTEYLKDNDSIRLLTPSENGINLLALTSKQSDDPRQKKGLTPEQAQNVKRLEEGIERLVNLMTFIRGDNSLVLTTPEVQKEATGQYAELRNIDQKINFRFQEYMKIMIDEKFGDALRQKATENIELVKKFRNGVRQIEKLMKPESLYSTSEQYHRTLEFVTFLSDKLGLKKESQTDLQADEKLVSAAIDSSLNRSQPTIIVSNDGDVRRMLETTKLVLAPATALSANGHLQYFRENPPTLYNMPFRHTGKPAPADTEKTLFEFLVANRIYPDQKVMSNIYERAISFLKDLNKI